MERSLQSMVAEQGLVDTPTHGRSRSDTTLTQPQLSPSPKFKEPPPKARDDNVLIATPSKFPSRANRESLVLQMPPRDPSNIFPPQLSDRSTPAYSPQAERESFESPTSVLPRHSRGLDFSRACTNLHHSTLPDQSTPDSSPKVSHRARQIPSRRQSNVSSMNLDSPRTNVNMWGERSAFRPRSLGSTTAMTSDASDSSSDSDEDMKSRYDPDDVLATPTMHKYTSSGGFTPYASREDTIRGGAVHNPSPDSRRFQPYRRSPRPPRGSNRLAALRTRHGNGTDDSSSSTDTNEMPIDSPSRRESISTVTNSLRISTTNKTGTSNDSDTEVSPATFKFNSPQVVRRPVTRRSNLLPKTKGFARIRAQLQDEASPVDSDVRRDAEVVRQVRIGSGANPFLPTLSHQSTADSSPDLTPTIPHHPNEASDLSDVDALGVTLPTTEMSVTNTTATTKPEDDLRRSSSKDFWLGHSRFSTPPLPLPHPLPRHRSSSGMSSNEDMRMDSPVAASATGLSSAGRSQSTSANAVNSSHRPESEAEATVFPAPSLPSAPSLPTAAEITRKATAKRRRDDDYFDPAGIKRRAVSPGMSVHSSPVMGQSPVSSTSGWWHAPPREKREGSGASNGGGGGGGGGGSTPNLSNVTSNGSYAESGKEGKDGGGREGRSMSMSSASGATSGGVSAMAPPSTPNLGARRVGLQQGMCDTNDGFVKMTLE